MSVWSLRLLSKVPKVAEAQETKGRTRAEDAPVEAGQATNIALCMAMESLRKGVRVRFNPTTRAMEI